MKRYIIFILGLSFGLWNTPLIAADIEAVLDDAAGGSAFVVQDSTATPVTMGSIDSDGNMVIKGGMRLDAAGAECITAENLIVDGSVGIGEVSPGSKLAVSGGATIGASYDTTAAPDNGMIVEGNVGIGTASPTTNLQVAQGTAGVGTISNDASGTAVTGVGTQFLNTFKVGDTITANAETHTIATITTNTALTTDAWTGANAGVAYTLVGGTRFSVLGSGNVGIGITAPAYKLDVAGTFSADSINVNDAYTLPTANGTADYVLKANANGTASWADVTGVGGAGDITSVGNVTSGAAFDGTQGTTLTFYNVGGNATLAYDGTTFTPSKSITGDVTGALTGNADTVTNGVYTTNNLSALAASTSAQLYSLLSDETGSASGTPLAVFNVNPTLTGATVAGTLNVTGALIEDSNAEDLVIRTNSVANQLVLDSGGNVGIGTASPAASLSITSASFVSPTTVAIGPQQAVTAQSTALNIVNNMTNVTTDGINKRGIFLESLDPFTGLTGAATNNYGIYIDRVSGADNNYAFVTTANSGNVGIGTTAPNTKLEVDGSGATATIQVEEVFALNRPQSTSWPNFVSFRVGQYAAEVDGRTRLDIALKNSPNANVADLTTVMTLQGDGKVGIGTTSFTSGGAKLEVVDGITFPATQVVSANANTLDDYEEGTWTPTFLPGTSGSITLSTAAGYYTKVGNMVTLSMLVIPGSSSSPVGVLNIGGIPFNVTADANYSAVGSCGRTQNVIPQPSVVTVLPNAIVLQVWVVGNNARYDSALWDMNGRASISITYKTD